MKDRDEQEQILCRAHVQSKYAYAAEISKQLEALQLAMVFHTIIETAKMYALEVKGYLTRVLQDIINGETDCDKLTPAYFASIKR